MPEGLHWETVKPLLQDTLTTLTQSKALKSFRLVGGTSLSLQLGHRMSDDIDLFTDDSYGSINFKQIDNFLRKTFPYVSDLGQGPVGMGESYLIGHHKNETVKLDIYYSDSFIQPPLQIGPYRLATVEEIIAMKVDIVQRRGRKKDFWDLHELLSMYSPAQMTALHKQRYPYSHDEKLIKANFTDFSEADNDFDPICLRGKHWELIKLDFVQALK